MQTLNLTKKYEKYSEYKDSGVEWLGEIPKEWEARKIKSFSKTIAGGTPATDNLLYWENGTIPWLPSGMVHDNLIVDNTKGKYITELGLKESAAKVIPKDSVLLALTGATCGNIAYLTFQATANQSVVAVVNDKRNSLAKYVFYVLLANREQILVKRTGGAQSGINEQDVKNLYISFPNLEEQIKIGKYLDQKTEIINQVIKKKQKQIELLREKRIAIIYNELVSKKTEKCQVEKIKHLVKSIESGIWGENPLENYDDIKCLRVADFDYENLSFSDVDTIRNNPELSVKKILQKGDILVEKSGGGEKTPVGRAILFDSDEKMVCANFIDIVRVDKEKVLPEFLVFYLSILYSGRINTKYIKQNTGIQNMDIKTYFQEMIYFPDTKTQKDIVNDIHKKMNLFNLALIKTQKSIELLKEFKSSLISNVVTGKVKI